MRDKILNFFTDIYKEMKKVTWPKKEEMRDYTKVVIVTMIIFSAFVYVVDKGISEVLKILF